MTAPKFQCNACGGVYCERSVEGGTYHHACPPLPKDKDGNVPVRENGRDENVTSVSTGNVPSIRSEGAGTKCLTNAKLAEPAWITGLKKRAPVEEPDGDE